MKAYHYSHPSGFPLAYHIVFTCYGTRLQGNPKGSVSKYNNTPGTHLLRIDAGRQHRQGKRMTQLPYELDEPRRRVVLEAIKEVCYYREWHLVAAHIRSNHVHAIVSANCRPEKVLGDFKAYASRALTRAGFESSSRRRWTVHGSTGYIWQEESLAEAVEYVIDGQGKMMEWYVEGGDGIAAD